MSFYDRGPSSYRVPFAMHKENRGKLVARFAKLANVPEGSLLFFEGGKTVARHATDVEHVFRQESFFQYLFGVKEPECYATIDAKTGKSTLFVPRLGLIWVVWMGEVPSPEDYKKHYEVDEVKFTDELEQFVQDTLPKDAKLYLLHGLGTDSGEMHPLPSLTWLSKFTTDSTDTLWNELVECRVFKSQEELKLLRHVNALTSNAHVHVMKNAKPGMMEYQIEADFSHHTFYYGGCRHNSYACICGSGPTAAVLHYGHAGAPNNKQVGSNDILLLDMGAEYHGYTSDVTRCFPITGKFDAQQRMVYTAVLSAQKAVMDAMKPGVHWLDMHRLSYKVLLEHLRAAGLVKGEIDEMIENDIGYLFMPHGLGHLIGLDTHDVGGYPPGTKRETKPGFKSVRCGRKLEAGMYITVEPGCYFNPSLLEIAYKDERQAKHLVREELDKFTNFGGVRIEDDVLVTEDGIENFTLVPSSIDEVEAILAQNPFIFPQNKKE